MVERAGSAELAGADEGARYPLPERCVDLLFEPRRLFRGLASAPRVWDAGLLSTAVNAALTGAGLLLLEPEDVAAATGADLSPALAALALGLRAGALWAFLATAALVGATFGGFVLADAPYRAWLSLAAHCSLVAAVVGPVELALGAWSGDPAFALDLGLLASGEADPRLERLLSRLSLRTAAFLALFSLGASVLTGARWSRAAVFCAAAWAFLWALLSWIGGCAV